MKILFIGCVESSYRLLLALAESGKQIIGVITKEKSNFNADFVDLTPICEKHRLPVYYAKNVNEQESLDFIKSLSPDICYCFGWSQLLKQELISLFSQGVVGFHPTALPNNRGRHPIVWALALGLKETASTFFMINVGVDEGAIVSQRKVVITYEDDARTLYDKILKVAVGQTMEFTEAFEKKKVTLISQDLSKGNTWRKRGKVDGEIDWRMSSRAIYNLVRSLTRPYIGAHFVLGGQDYKVWKVQEIDIPDLDNIEPGKIIAVNVDGTVDIRVSDGAIKLIEFDKPEINEGDYIQ